MSSRRLISSTKCAINSGANSIRENDMPRKLQRWYHPKNEAHQNTARILYILHVVAAVRTWSDHGCRLTPCAGTFIWTIQTTTQIHILPPPLTHQAGISRPTFSKQHLNSFPSEFHLKCHRSLLGNNLHEGTLKDIHRTLLPAPCLLMAQHRGVLWHGNGQVGSHVYSERASIATHYDYEI